MAEYVSIAVDVKLGKGTKLAKFINLYRCIVGDDTKIGPSLRSRKMPQ